jgi:hypothetical protein
MRTEDEARESERDANFCRECFVQKTEGSKLLVYLVIRMCC